MMIGFIAIGLIALGAFSFAEVRYGRIPKERLGRVVDYLDKLRSNNLERA